jgi:hypothetical protein
MPLALVAPMSVIEAEYPLLKAHNLVSDPEFGKAAKYAH